MGTDETTMTFEDSIGDLRKEIKQLAKRIESKKEAKGKSESNGVENIGEIMANLTLCYRHLEDASMRLGKVLQHRAGGQSIYDSNVVGDPRADDIKKEYKKD